MRSSASHRLMRSAEKEKTARMNCTKNPKLLQLEPFVDAHRTCRNKHTSERMLRRWRTRCRTRKNRRLHDTVFLRVVTSTLPCDPYLHRRGGGARLPLCANPRWNAPIPTSGRVKPTDVVLSSRQERISPAISIIPRTVQNAQIHILPRALVPIIIFKL